ncbi:MAG: hypothetical protein CL398_05550 [Acidiferrobacteraceae bacterium]|nr:hypothetical protein [Acidiferrobacteraceae bacterium]|tara:strand:- start:57 stop:761 length:705 start_codon:yes stop_codon:yes gene_type:complete
MVRFINIILCFAVLMISPLLAVSDENLPLHTDQQKLSYTLGYQIGGQLANQIGQSGLNLDPGVFAQAIADVLSSRPPILTASEMEAVLQAYQNREQEKQNEAAEVARIRGEVFQTEYGRREGVLATKSGLQYRVIETGDGRSPGPSDTVVVHYVGRLIDETVFDSSRQRNTPATFSLGSIILGWQEILQLMREGDLWEVVIPSELAYGTQGAGPSSKIGPNETLVFEIELISIK